MSRYSDGKLFYVWVFAEIFGVLFFVEWYSIMNEEGKASSFVVITPVFSEQCVILYFRILGICSQFGFLDCRNVDIFAL